MSLYERRGERRNFRPHVRKKTAEHPLGKNPLASLATGSQVPRLSDDIHTLTPRALLLSRADPCYVLPFAPSLPPLLRPSLRSAVHLPCMVGLGPRAEEERPHEDGSLDLARRDCLACPIS